MQMYSKQSHVEHTTAFRLRLVRLCALIVSCAVLESESLSSPVGVASVLISFIGLMAMADGILGALCKFCGLPLLKLDMVFGYLLTPCAVLMGVDMRDAITYLATTPNPEK